MPSEAPIYITPVAEVPDFLLHPCPACRGNGYIPVREEIPETLVVRVGSLVCRRCGGNGYAPDRGNPTWVDFGEATI
jgi:hypothetical protein